MKINPIFIEFMDADFFDTLVKSGMPESLAKNLASRSDGEYWNLELRFNESGTFTGKIVK